MSAYAELTPIIVLTGFLGSGKTTLLNRLLKHPALGDAAVLINEFGEVGIDHQLVEAVDESTVLLSSGCLCCTIRDDLKQAILEVHDKRARGLVPPYRRMIVETTGLADPAPILATLMNDVSLRHHYRLGTIVTTVGRRERARSIRAPGGIAEAGRGGRPHRSDQDRPRGERARGAARAQARPNQPVGRASNRRAGQRGRGPGAARRRLTTPPPGARRCCAGSRREAAASHAHAARRHDVNRHDASIHSFCLIHDEPVEWTAFGIWLTMLLHTHGERILRVKGLLNVAGADTPVVINRRAAHRPPPGASRLLAGREAGSPASSSSCAGWSGRRSRSRSPSSAAWAAARRRGRKRA